MAKQMKFYASFQAQTETPMDEEQLQKIGEEVVQVLSEIYDPEIPVDIYQLGLIYDVQVSEDKDVKILMTPTSLNCLVGESLPEEVRLSKRLSR